MSAYKIQMPGNYPEESIQQICCALNISQNVKMELHIVDLHEIIKKLYSNSGQRISSI